MVSRVGIVFGALFAPGFIGALVHWVFDPGFLASATLGGLLLFAATVVVGLRFGTWRALYLAAMPGGLLLAIVVFSIFGVFNQVGEWSLDLLAVGILILTSIWLVGIAVGIVLRKVVFRHSEFFT
jgi:hypothetical protein